MENNDGIVPVNIYQEQLLTINGIKFTHREIDVIACIFHTRGAGKIATLLSISISRMEFKSICHEAIIYLNHNSSHKPFN